MEIWIIFMNLRSPCALFLKIFIKIGELDVAIYVMPVRWVFAIANDKQGIVNIGKYCKYGDWNSAHNMF